mgnify:CR=1 FL=1|jgi:D-cysteine desulfhydrase
MTLIELLDNDFWGNCLYVKREDLLPFSFGGNKARKAQLIFNKIDSENVDYVVTYGSSSSNHCRVVANACAIRKLPCMIISPTEDKKSTFNRTLVRILGAEIRVCAVNDVPSVIQETLIDLRSKGLKPYFIEGGGHGIIGTHAYVLCYDEIQKYETMSVTNFDYIFLASGTGTTQAGLICGKILHGSSVDIVGISIARKNPYGANVVHQSVYEYMTQLGINNDFRSYVKFIDDYTLEGYGVCNAEINEQIDEVLRRYGIALNTTYTGKAFWGMEQYLEDQSIRGKRILFINTGGVPNVFDDLEARR